MSSGREKKIQIGGQMSIAKNTSTTLVNVIRSIACLCQYQICFSKPWLCWLSRAGPPSTVRSDRIEPVTKKENDTHQVISIRWFCSFWFPFHVHVSIIIDEFINHTKWHFFICSTNDLLTLHAPDWFSMSRTSEKGLSVPNYYLHPIKASRSTASSQLNMFFCFQTLFMIMTMRPTAALDTTIFWSHSIKTSRNVTFRLSVACRTFPGKGDKIMISKSIWNFACSTDLTSLHKRPTNMHMLIIMCVLASL